PRIHMVVGVDALRADLRAAELQRAVRDHLVRVHVRRGAASRLEDVDHEVRIVLTGDHLVSGLDDILRERVLQQAQLRVRLCRCLLEHAERGNELAREPQVADGKVFYGPLRLCTPQCIGRNLHLAERVLLDPEFRLTHGASMYTSWISRTYTNRGPMPLGE